MTINNSRNAAGSKIDNVDSVGVRGLLIVDSSLGFLLLRQGFVTRYSHDKCLGQHCYDRKYCVPRYNLRCNAIGTAP